jgi:hypothetical protein
MKRALIEENKSSVQPVLMMVNYRTDVDETGWVSRTSAQIIDSSGTEYTCDYGKNIGNKDTVYWCGEVDNIVKNGTSCSLTKDTETVNTITDFAKSASKYKDCNMTIWNFGIDDYGEETLYALYPDESGKMQMLELCRFGGPCAWLDNAEVQEFVTMLIENGYYADKDAFEDYLRYQQ